jgi:hypothetical protein
MRADAARWPELPLHEWKETYDTLHMWTQIVGKVRLALAPLTNHWWNGTLSVTPTGLTTSFNPYGKGGFEVLFDFLRHLLVVDAVGATHQMATMALSAYPVAEFYDRFIALLRSLRIEVSIWPVPVEVERRIPFNEDHVHATYDPEYAERFWRVLVRSERVFQVFRARFIGKCSPVHFFWGAFDMAVTRFSGRTAPPHPPAPNVAHYVVVEAYSHEVSSCGFWPGGGAYAEPAYYSYAYPEPPGCRDRAVRPDGALYLPSMGEYILPYDCIRTSADPDADLLAFLQSTYDAAADAGHWDRAGLERVETPAFPFRQGVSLP